MSALLQNEVYGMARPKSLSRHLRQARVSRGLSVAAVAEEVGVTPSSVYHWESGRCRPRNDKLSAICKLLRVPVREALEMS